MHPFFYVLVTATGIFMAVTSCNSSGKIGKRINANVVLSADSIKKMPPPAETVKHYDSIQIEFGDKLSVPYDSIYNLKLYSFIKENLGKKCFSSKKLNYDCEAFLPSLFYEVYGITIPATANEQIKYNNFELFKNTRYLKLGDVVFFNNSQKRKDRISHAGFYLYNDFFVVVTANEGIVLRKMNDAYWLSHFVAAGRINKLATADN
jgi:hypothetical protein